jgi:chemotaxis protein methyltransferase CheR
MAFTFFFRDTQTLEMITEIVLPDLKRRQFIRVWDAGCAFGPEPYSLAIMMRENMGKFLFRNVKIDATDIDESDFGTIIANGVYSEQELGRIPPEIFSKYFAPVEPGRFQICQELRQAVKFQRHNLLSLQPVRQDFGLIVCKNVLLHFTSEQRTAVVTMFHNALYEDGYLVTEQTQKLPPGTEHLFRQVTGAAQLYQKISTN